MKKIIILLFCSSMLWASSYYPKKTSMDGEWRYHIQSLPQPSHYIYTFTGKEERMSLPKNWYKHEYINHAGVMWFERSFTMKDLPLAAKHFLEFTGVDYICEVWINDHYAGSHQGYFQTFDFDITPFLKRGKNFIKVKVNSPLENYPENYSLHKTLLRGIFSHHDTRPGGAWSAKGQDKNSGGIWNHIAIKSYQEYKFHDLKATPILQDDAVDLHVKVDIETLKKSSQASFLYFKQRPYAQNTVTLTLSPVNFQGKSFKQSIVLGKKDKLDVTMHLPGAKLWYTYDRGAQNLYMLTVQIGETKTEHKIGFKSLTQDKNKTFYLNRVPYYIKGTNYISSQYMSEMDESKLRRDLMLMKEAHINTIRVHAHIEPKRFYTLCDEMGFLVWQDYNLQWGYIDSEAFAQEAQKQLVEMISMLYNHPSIFVWSLHNEPPWDSDWMKWKYPDYSKTQNKTLDDRLYRVIQSEDSYHLSKKYSSNLEHPWFGWYSGKYQDFNKTSKVPVITEYGAQAIPNLSSLKKFIPQKYLLPKSKKAKQLWEYHNYQFDWSEKNGVKFKGNLKQFIADSQTYQAKLIKYATEMLRIQKYQGTTGIFQFMFNEGWPSMNWGIVDYYRHIKPGYTALQKAYAPIIIVAKQVSPQSVELYVVNDTLHDIDNANLFVTAYAQDNKQSYTYPVAIEKDSVQKVATLTYRQLKSLDMSLETDKQLAYNHYEFKPVPKQATKIVAKRIGSESVELYVINNTLDQINNANLFVTVHSQISQQSYKYPVTLKKGSTNKIATLTYKQLKSLDMSLETDKQLAYKHYEFKPLVKQTKKEDKP